MKGISVKHIGDFSKTERFLNAMKGQKYLNKLADYGEDGNKALSEATPVDSGLTAKSWNFVIERSKGSTSINWINTNTNNGFNVAMALQYGHGTGGGGYVAGRDYINPAIRPVADKISEGVWKEVTSS